jgi:hypothetical protein
MTFIRRNTFVGIVSIDTSRNRAARVISTGIIIVTNNRYIFARRRVSAIRITCIGGTCIVVITNYRFIITSSSRITGYRMASIFICAFIDFILTPNVSGTIINSTQIVIVAINWRVGTSSGRVASINSTCIVIIARDIG